jgi:hypothetical protein
MNREQLIAAMKSAAAVAPLKVDVQGYGGAVYVRALTVAEVEEQTADTQDGKDKQRIARGACRVICDETGQRIFDPADAGDVALLSSQPWSILQGILAKSNEFNGQGEAGAAEAKND